MHCRFSPAARGSYGIEGNYNGYCNPEIAAPYGCTYTLPNTIVHGLFVLMT